MFDSSYYHEDMRASLHSGSNWSRTRWFECTETITSPTVYSKLTDAGRRKGGKRPLMKQEVVRADLSRGSELLDAGRSQLSEMSDLDERLKWSKGLRVKLDELTAHHATPEGRLAAQHIKTLRRRIDSENAPGPRTLVEFQLASDIENNSGIALGGWRRSKFLKPFIREIIGDKKLIAELFELNAHYDTYYHDVSAVQLTQEKKRIKEVVDLVRILRRYS